MNVKVTIAFAFSVKRKGKSSSPKNVVSRTNISKAVTKKVETKQSLKVEGEVKVPCEAPAKAKVKVSVPVYRRWRTFGEFTFETEKHTKYSTTQTFDAHQEVIVGSVDDIPLKICTKILAIQETKTFRPTKTINIKHKVETTQSTACVTEETFKTKKKETILSINDMSYIQKTTHAVAYNLETRKLTEESESSRLERMLRWVKIHLLLEET